VNTIFAYFEVLIVIIQEDEACVKKDKTSDGCHLKWQYAEIMYSKKRSQHYCWNRLLNQLNPNHLFSYDLVMGH